MGLGNGTFKDVGVSHNGGIYPSANYETSDHLIHRGRKYFEAEAINTNGNTWGEYFKENEYE